MKPSQGQLSSYIFKRAVSEDLGQFSLDGLMLNFIVELDGKRTVAEIAQKIGLGIGEIKDTVKRLLALKLIEPVEMKTPAIDKDFIEFLKVQFSIAIGPIAMVIIEDAAADLGHDIADFPARQAAELVDLLSREIQREEERTKFTQNLVKKIMEKGY